MALLSIKVRRKPQQSRAKMTQAALVESFVRLLKEKPSADITIREMTELAGVGLGTFYEYFSQKEDLIALTIHQYVKSNAKQLKQQAELWRTERDQKQLTLAQLKQLIKYLLRFQIRQIQAEQQIWAQLFLLERQISSPEAYQKHYQLMIYVWDQALNCYTHNPAQNLSLNIHRISYGFISQSLLVNPDFQHWDQLAQEIIHLIFCLLPETEKIGMI